MRPYRRILSIADLSPQGAKVVGRASQLARFYSASLSVACIVDYPPGLECDHVPFMTPVELRRAIVRDVTEKLQELVDQAGGAGADLIVAEGNEGDTEIDLVGSLRPDLVVAAERTAIRLSAATTGFDVLAVQSDKPGLAGRLIQALAFGFET